MLRQRVAHKQNLNTTQVTRGSFIKALRELHVFIQDEHFQHDDKLALLDSPRIGHRHQNRRADTSQCRERRQPSISKHCHLTPPASSFSSSSSSSSSFERVWYCHLPNLKMLTNYIINVTTLSSTGSSSFHLSSFMLEDIVKPDPPVDVKVLAYHARNVLVGWSAPPTWSHLDMVPLKYQITYQWDHKGRTKSVSFPLESTAMELKGLSPGREYVFQVCTMDLLGLGQWSLWSSPITVTLPTIKMSQVRLLSES
ncbi:interleukin-27 subunit beta-like isoform X2 [Syngnathus typhle]|uniref:interleukin-27 subunit beta-like isoform X2 n=1 Tax=Syngnathus typhle TaxID=161592 RepID=UPI002A6AF5F6|nr:interleukin-27 subunit beta-like isoform X2 [Syngnathus typhle]